MLRSQNNTEVPSCPKPPGREKPHVHGHQAALVHGFARQLWSAKQKRWLTPNTSGMRSLMGQTLQSHPVPQRKGWSWEGLLSIPGQTEARWG